RALRVPVRTPPASRPTAGAGGPDLAGRVPGLALRDGARLGDEVTRVDHADRPVGLVLQDHVESAGLVPVVAREVELAAGKQAGHVHLIEGVLDGLAVGIAGVLDGGKENAHGFVAESLVPLRVVPVPLLESVDELL